MAGQRLGRRRAWSTDLLSIDGHTHDPHTRPRRRHFDRSDRVIAIDLLIHVSGRFKERQHHLAGIKWWHANTTTANVNVSVSELRTNGRSHFSDDHWHKFQRRRHRQV